MVEGSTVADVVDEARRLAGLAKRTAVEMRLLGGTAVRLHLTDYVPAISVRDVEDIDVVTTRHHRVDLERLLTAQGYRADEAFNALNGRRRLLFHDDARRRQLDVFVDTFEMCHCIAIAERLEADWPTIPLAELLLTKLQVVELNEKDRNDAYAILLAHPVGDGDVETVNGDRIGDLCSREWGLYHTLTLNLNRLHDGLEDQRLEPAERAVLVERLNEIAERMDAAPKGGRWRMRARVGPRVRWFAEPEEVA